MLFDNGSVLVFTLTEIWLEIKKFDNLYERVLCVELDSIVSYDVRNPFEENENTFSDANEQGGLGALLMLKNCMGLLTNELS